MAAAALGAVVAETTATIATVLLDAAFTMPWLLRFTQDWVSVVCTAYYFTTPFTLAGGAMHATHREHLASPPFAALLRACKHAVTSD